MATTGLALVTVKEKGAFACTPAASVAVTVIVPGAVSSSQRSPVQVQVPPVPVVGVTVPWSADRVTVPPLSEYVPCLVARVPSGAVAPAGALAVIVRSEEHTS